MPILNYQEYMLPLLRLFSDGKDHRISEAVEALSKEFNLSEKEKGELLPSGQQTVIHSRIGWAKTYMRKAGLLSSPGRGVDRITQRGLDVIAKNPPKIDNNFLAQFDEFQDFKHTFRDTKGTKTSPSDANLNEATPEELLESAYQRLYDNLKSDLIQKIKTCSPSFFERLVIDTIVGMGYGGNRRDAGQAVGKSGDGGIDGIIKEDRLGLDTIYLQAKRWDNVVGRPEIQKFVGALAGMNAKKGIFITTSSFTTEAKDYVSQIETKIILIDGKMLADLMIEHGIGVSIANSYKINKIDLDYFAESD